jgi:hypothetical protein
MPIGVSSIQIRKSIVIIHLDFNNVVAVPVTALVTTLVV